MNQPPQRDDTFENVVMVLLFLFIGLLVIVWAGANLASLVAHGQVLGASFEDAGHAMLQLRHHLGDPRSAWPPELGARLPGPILYWAATAVVVAAAVMLGVGAHKVFRDPVEPLDRRRRAGVSAQGRLARRSDLHPLLVRRPQPDRFVLGRAGHRLIATEATTTKTRRRRQTAGRGAVMPVGPSRSGKTTSIINGVFHWRHPAVLVSLKGDFLDVTGTWRDSLGDVQVFDPSGVTGHESATWSPLRGATTVSGAVRAARQIAEAAPRQQSTEHGDFWSNMAESLLAALLVVAANSKDRTFADVVRWVVGTDVPDEGFVGEVQPLVRALKGDGDAQRKEAGRFATTVLRSE
ncbi:MAG: type IV secretory system conjugative DNA transfer family protein, partial [Actinobacteria bacterium]|nr:type IV secretory system conjugative DNA transfer family protein [Actinomycetota bacterium]